MPEIEIGTLKDNPNICFKCSSFLEVPGDNDVLLGGDEEEHLLNRVEDSETRYFHG